MTVTEAPILSRLDRLDNVSEVEPENFEFIFAHLKWMTCVYEELRQLEEIRSCNRSPKSSNASTPSSGTLTSDGHVSSVDIFSPKSLEKHCRPIEHVVMETEVKGTLIERLDHVEDRVIKLCLQLEEQIGAEKQREEKVDKKAHKKGFKQIVKQILKGNRKHKSRTN